MVIAHHELPECQGDPASGPSYTFVFYRNLLSLYVLTLSAAANLCCLVQSLCRNMDKKAYR